MLTKDINVIALIKNKERYIFLYDNKSTIEIMKTLHRFALNPELSFTRYDAKILASKIITQK